MYQGSWTPAGWREAVVDALVVAFGAESVDTSGKIAVNIGAVEESRPTPTLSPVQLPALEDPARRSHHEGSCVFPTDGGSKVVNWPNQQLVNGRQLNTDTNRRYKNYVRALKNAENFLAAAGTIEEMPSYFMECLVFNVSKSTLMSGDLDDGFRATLVELWNLLKAEDAKKTMVEPNRLKWLFTSDKKWSLQDGKDLIQATWTHFGYGD